MKKQCNLCGLRQDRTDLVGQKKTWCLVLDQEVDNKQPGCEHWRPDRSLSDTEKVQVAEGIKKTRQSQIDREKQERTEAERHADVIEQQILGRKSVDKIAKQAFWISIISAVIAAASCIAAWVAANK